MNNEYYKKYIKYKTKYLELTNGGNYDNKEIHVNEPWFSLIKNGTKKVEGRLNKGQFAYFKENDIVTWFNIDKQTKQKKEVNTKIIKINKYKTFEEMLTIEGLNNVLPDKNIKTIEDGINVYRQWYNEEMEKQFGVIAIVITVI